MEESRCLHGNIFIHHGFFLLLLLSFLSLFSALQLLLLLLLLLLLSTASRSRWQFSCRHSSFNMCMQAWF